MSNVLLLRSPSKDPSDRYETVFTAARHHPISIPVLETVHKNLTVLETIIRRGPHAGEYGGVILTSKRSCDSWGAALQNIADSPSPPTEDDRPGLEAWSTVPFYVVGQATSSTLSELRDSFGEIGFNPAEILGEASGTGERLGHFIVKDKGRLNAKLLYLTGDKNRDVLPGILKEGGVEFEPLQVYETQGSSNFERDLDAKIAAIPNYESISWWIVYFAPSAAEFVTPILSKHFNVRPLDPVQDSSLSRTPTPRIAAIGPTTASFLRDKLKLNVDVQASTPTPEDLLSAIAAYSP